MDGRWTSRVASDSCVSATERVNQRRNRARRSGQIRMIRHRQDSLSDCRSGRFDGPVIVVGLQDARTGIRRRDCERIGRCSDEL